MNQEQSNNQSQSQSQNDENHPKRRRYRIPRSCDRCRASKIKCVFEDGKCTACVNARVPCTFANPGSLKARPPTQKDLEHLHARIRSLERLIHAIEPTFDLSSLPPLAESHHPNSYSIANQQRFSISSSTHFQSDHSIQKRPEISSEAHGPESHPALAGLFFPTQIHLNTSAGNLLHSLTDVDDLSPVDKAIQQQHQQTLYSNLRFYPEPDLEQALLELYFTKVQPHAPILHPATFMKDLKSGLSLKDDSFRVLCLAVMAIASRFSKDPRVYLDLDGNPVPSLQAAGFRYATVVASYLFRPIAAPANINDLQATMLISLFALGSTSPDDAWDIIGLGLQKAQEVGAQFENSPMWTACPIKDRIRRVVFLVLYEFDSLLSSAIGKPASMQESDFDVLPPDASFEKAIGTFINPFAPPESANAGPDEVTDDFIVAYQSLRSSLGAFKNLFPVIDVMNAQKGSNSGVKFSSRIESLVNELDASAIKCYEKIAQKFNAFESIKADISDSQLVSSVNAITYYHEFRLLIHRLLFNYKGAKNNPQDETQSTPVSKPMSNPHAEICVESARMIVTLIDRLHQRNTLDLAFFWLPLRLTNAIIILIASLKKNRKTLSVEQRQLRCSEITLGIQILSAMAPTTFMAAKFSKMMAHYYESILQQCQDHRQHSKKTTSSSPPQMIRSSSFSSPIGSSPHSDPEPSRAASSVTLSIVESIPAHPFAHAAFDNMGLPQSHLDEFHKPDPALSSFLPFDHSLPPSTQYSLNNQFCFSPRSPIDLPSAASEPLAHPILPHPHPSDFPCDPHHDQML